MARNVNFEKLAVQCVQVWGALVEYEPSVYGGDGTEPRKNIVLAITEEEQAFFQLLEQVVDSKKLTSCIKEGTVKAKVTLDAVNIYDFEKSGKASRTMERSMRQRSYTDARNVE